MGPSSVREVNGNESGELREKTPDQLREELASLKKNLQSSFQHYRSARKYFANEKCQA